MRAGQGHPDCPAWDGEDAADYIRRYAIKLGFIASDAPEPGRRLAPRETRSYEQRLAAIWGDEPGSNG